MLSYYGKMTIIVSNYYIFACRSVLVIHNKPSIFTTKIG